MSEQEARLSSTTITSACPNCGMEAERQTYDIGSGPELSCSNCEWCWGANGQLLNPILYNDVVQQLGYDPMSPPIEGKADEEDPASRKFIRSDKE